MKSWTVVLARSGDLCERLDIEYPSYYVANRLESATARTATDEARDEVVAADVKDNADSDALVDVKIDKTQYALVCVFEGHHDVAMYDFQE